MWREYIYVNTHRSIHDETLKGKGKGRQPASLSEKCKKQIKFQIKKKKNLSVLKEKFRKKKTLKNKS